MLLRGFRIETFEKLFSVSHEKNRNYFIVLLNFLLWKNH